MCVKVQLIRPEGCDTSRLMFCKRCCSEAGPVNLPPSQQKERERKKRSGGRTMTSVKK